MNTTTRRDYTSWRGETPTEETRDGQAASYERWLGKKIAQAAIAEYNSTWGEYHGRELITRQSVRRFANKLAESSTQLLR